MCSWVKVEEQWLCLLDLFSFFLDVNQQQLAEERSIISAYFEPCCHHFLCLVTVYSLLTLLLSSVTATETTGPKIRSELFTSAH